MNRRLGWAAGLGAVILVLAAGARPATAQVGYPPSRSPYVNVDQTMEVTPLFGYFRARRDPAGVAPQGGPVGGLSYEWRASGPLHVGAEFLYVHSERTVMNPANALASRNLGLASQPLYALNGFLALSLTGERTWHHLMPMLNGGLALISDLRSADVGGYKFGTRVGIPLGASMRIIPGDGRWQLRGDVKDWLYTVSYPEAYYFSSTSEAPILATSVAKSRWTHNASMTLGLSYSFSR